MHGSVKATVPLKECLYLPPEMGRQLKEDLKFGPAGELFPDNMIQWQPLLANQNLLTPAFDGTLFTLVALFNFRVNPLNPTGRVVYAFVNVKRLIASGRIFNKCCFVCAAADLLQTIYNYEEAP